MTAAHPIIEQRSQQYGHPADNFSTIAGLWTVLLHRLVASAGGDVKDFSFQPQDVAMFLALVKISREAYRHSADNLTDIAGYARCAEIIHEHRGDA